MKKKSRTPEEKVKRAKRVLTILASMGLVCLVAGLTQKCSNNEDKDPILLAFDSKIDSLLMKETQFVDPIVVEKESYKICRITPPCIQEDSLAMLEVRLELGNLNDIEINSILEQIKNYKAIIEEYRKNKDNEIIYYNRRIRFATKDDKIYTCIQTLDTNCIQSMLKHIICLNDILIDEKQLNISVEKYN